jgi:hypothetical protein
MRSDIYLMFRLKWLKLSMLFMLLAASALVAMQKLAMDYVVKIDRVLFLPLVMYGIAVAALISMTSGSDFDEGFIRNKLFAGQSRRQIYLAHEVANLVGAIVLYCITVLFTLVISIKMFEINVSIQTLAVYFFLGLFTCVAYSCIFHMIAMLAGRPFLSSAICLILAVLMLLLSIYTNSALVQGNEPNAFHLFLYDLNPTGQIAQLSSMQVLNPLRSITLDVLWVLITHAIGLSLFGKKAFQ